MKFLSSFVVLAGVATLSCAQVGQLLKIRVHRGTTVRYSVVIHGAPVKGNKPKPTNERRKETYRVQTIDKKGVITFHTAYQMSGSPHGPTKGEGELQLMSNGVPPEGFTSFIFDNAALSDLDYPSGPIPGGNWSAPVKSFGNPNAGRFIFSPMSKETVNGISCIKMSVMAGPTQTSKGKRVQFNGTATYWISTADGLPVKKTIQQKFGDSWVINIVINRV
jgi:hypothetical protein